MKASTHSIRLKRLTVLFVLGAIVIGTAATVAIGSNGRPAVQAGDRIVDDYWRDQPSVVAQTGDRIVDDYWRDPQPVTIAQPTGSGFDWGDWSIGLVAGFGLALGIAGALLLVRRLPRPRNTGPAVG
jgi:hypothetical protein